MYVYVRVPCWSVSGTVFVCVCLCGFHDEAFWSVSGTMCVCVYVCMYSCTVLICIRYCVCVCVFVWILWWPPWETGHFSFRLECGGGNINSAQWRNWYHAFLVRRRKCKLGSTTQLVPETRGTNCVVEPSLYFLLRTPVWKNQGGVSYDQGVCLYLYRVLKCLCVCVCVCSSTVLICIRYCVCVCVFVWISWWSVLVIRLCVCVCLRVCLFVYA
jgi:hypothetical protein